MNNFERLQSATSFDEVAVLLEESELYDNIDIDDFIDWLEE